MDHVMRTLIVDDEPVARQILREELELLPKVEVAGEAENGRQALQKIAEIQPDLVFLDLQMPVMSGFEVIRNLPGPALPVVVIVTAFDEHAIQAFEAGAIDYLLKPVDGDRLQKAVERARRLRNRPDEIADNLARIVSSTAAPGATKSRKIPGRSGNDYYLLDPGEILAFCADRELVWIITARQKFLARQSLRTIQDLVDQRQFRRVHRNALVNVDHVRRMCPLSSQRWRITLSNSTELIVSKRQAHSIRSIPHW